jgi:hypothetical protein
VLPFFNMAPSAIMDVPHAQRHCHFVRRFVVMTRFMTVSLANVSPVKSSRRITVF